MTMTIRGRLRKWLCAGTGFGLLATCAMAQGDENRLEPAAAATSATQPATATQPAATTQPAVTTRPAPDDPIIRVGDAAVVTQAEFDMELRGRSPRDPFTALAMASNALVNRKLIELYIKEHPGFVTPEEIDAAVEDYMKRNEVKTLDEFKQRLNDLGYTLDYFRWRKMEEIAFRKFNVEGTRLSEDEELLKKMWNENRADWDGRRVVARHILLAFPAFATPEQKKEVLDKAKAIRDDLVTGKRTWEQCVKESVCRTRNAGGRLGSFRRHLDLNYGDKLAGVAFDLEKDEISDVVETGWGYHILQVTDKRPGGVPFEDAKKRMRIWLRMQPKAEAIKPLYVKYPIVGVQWPAPPLPIERAEAVARGSRSLPKATRRPHPRSQPAGRPTTRPAPSRTR